MFSYEDLKTFEFLEDLKYYYKDGHAFNITSEMTQPLFDDIIEKMSALKNGAETKRTILNFAHEETVLPLLTALGLYKDEKDILASDWPTKDHLWKTSRIGSFASNLGILVLQQNAERDSNGKIFSSEEVISTEQTISSEERDSSEEKYTSGERGFSEENMSSGEKDSS